MKKIKYICSLGFNCHVGQLLKINELKLASYPFDWIMTNLETVKKSIEDDFTLFLDKNQYIDLYRDDRCGHKTYCENMFVHHNPLYNNDDYNYFCRCVNRFRDLLKITENKLFIISIINGEHGIGEKLSSEIFQKFRDFNCFLKKYTSNFDLLIIINYPNKSSNKCKKTEIDNLIILEIDTLSINCGTHYDDDKDNKYLFNQIIKLFKFKLNKIH